jgi:hypothetical protein
MSSLGEIIENKIPDKKVILIFRLICLVIHLKINNLFLKIINLFDYIVKDRYLKEYKNKFKPLGYTLWTIGDKYAVQYKNLYIRRVFLAMEGFKEYEHTSMLELPWWRYSHRFYD